MIDLPKAKMIEGLPGGNIGGSALVGKASMEKAEDMVALKMSRYPGEERRTAWEEELDKSIELSGFLPNSAQYHSMAEVEGYEDYPAFSMEIVKGFPILDRNIACIDGGRLQGILSERSIDQLGFNLQLATDGGWKPRDLQYFLLLADQTLNGREHKRGDIVLFDFANWYRGSDSTDLAQYVERLQSLLHV